MNHSLIYKPTCNNLNHLLMINGFKYPLCIKPDKHLYVRHTSEMRQAVTVACVVCIIRYFLLFVSRCYRFVRRTWELIFVFTSIAKFLKSTLLSDWPVMGVSEHWPWSFRLSTAPLATWSITLVKVWTASVLWCQGHWRSFRMMRLLPF